MDEDFLAELIEAGYSPAAIEAALDSLPEPVFEALVGGGDGAGTMPEADNPLEQAQLLDSGYVTRDHLTYLSDRLAEAVVGAENGTRRNPRLAVSMPPRSGKSQLVSIYLPVWLLRRHPEWRLGLISHDPSLATMWGRNVRNIVEEHGPALGLDISRDAGAASEWETTAKGGILSRSAPGQSVTGRGFNVLIIDDIVKDFATAHSEVHREAIWNYWLHNAISRMQPPGIIIVVGTRWHEDDFIGRLLSIEHEGDPADWEVISFPAIAEEHDALGREPGEPLHSPLIDETPQEALDRWRDIKASNGTYAWSALYQQRPTSAKGAVFDTDWWRFWTTDPARATRREDGTLDPDGKVVLLNPDDLRSARWLDSWDCAFKDTNDSDFVVGQRWAMRGVNRYLIDQSRSRRTFTSTVAEMRRWAGVDEHDNPHPLAPPFTAYVHERVVEDKANGTAVIDVLKNQVSGLLPENPTNSKEARARAITPEIESGHVFLPHPSEDGKEWVLDLVEEHKQFPTGAHDDQVDALSQALRRLHRERAGSIYVPGRKGALPPATQRGRTALMSVTRDRGGPRDRR